jgi:hypothetical protein
MRIFHELLFDGFTAGSTVVSSPLLCEQLGAVDQLSIGGYTFNVTSSGSPALTVQLQFSTDLENWSGTNLLSGLVLSTSQETLFQTQDPCGTVLIKQRYARVGFVMSGTATQGYLRAWVTGRDQSAKAVVRVPAQGAPSDVLRY